MSLAEREMGLREREMALKEQEFERMARIQDACFQDCAEK